jgi:hypothetical protein
MLLVFLPIPGQDDQVRRGHMLFVEQWTKCHGEQGEGKL